MSQILMDGRHDCTDMNKILKIMRGKSEEGNGIEGRPGFYERIQRLKEYLHDEFLMDDKIQEGLAESSKNKILVVTHSMVMKALTSTGLRENPDL